MTPEAIRARDRIYGARYRAKNRERIRAKTAAYRAAHLEQARAKSIASNNAHRPRIAEWRRINATRIRVVQNAWAAAHPEKISAANRKWRERNHEHVAAVAAAWGKAHPEMWAAANARRRARIAGAEGSHSTAEWRALLRATGHRCAYCDRSDVPLTRDHRIPLVRGGSDYIANIAPACARCNSKKGTRTDLEYLGRIAA